MEKTEKTLLEEIQGTLSEIISQVKKLIREGNARRVIIKNKNGKILFQSQLTLGVAGTAFIVSVAPVISTISAILLFANDARVFVEKEQVNEEDEYEVAAEVIEIQDEEDNGNDNSDEKTDKTVG